MQFSFEPRGFTVEQTVRMARKIVDTYPQIDDLELITEETGGWGAGCTGEAVRQTLNRWFGLEIASDSLVAGCITDRQSDLEYLYRQIGTISRANGELGRDSAFRQRIDGLKVGIYCSVGRFMGPAFRLARLAAAGYPVAIMPSHGSKGTADVFPPVVRKAGDLAHTELYSWIEFDRLMYLQQIDRADSLYLEAGRAIASLYDGSSRPAARQYLALLGNRLSATVKYLQAFKTATKLRTIRRNADGTVPEPEQKRASEICDRALAGCEGCMTGYARLMPDCGTEGTVMSVWFSPMQGLRALRSSLAGVAPDEPLPSDVPRDEPPLPIFYEKL